MVDTGDAIIPLGGEALDTSELGQAARRSSTRKHRDHVDGFRDQCARDRDDGLLDQLLEASKCANGCCGVDRSDAAGVPRAPSLQEIERLGAPHLADGDPVRRSEEHTSELQSLMRNSYAVVCLKKKIYKHQKQTVVESRHSMNDTNR